MRASLLRVTVTPGSTASVSSVTLPVIVPVWVWARIIGVNNIKNKGTTKSFLMLFITSPIFNVILILCYT